MPLDDMTMPEQPVPPGSSEAAAPRSLRETCNSLDVDPIRAGVLPDEIVIPVCRPLLPSAARVMPYLARLDESRIYSNHGALVRQLEERLSAAFGFSRPVLVTASNGTAALSAAILAAAGRATVPKPLCLMPAYTFIATHLAAVQCGYETHLVDVDPDSWTIDPERLRACPQLARAGVVVVVSPYGRPVAQQPWIEFQRQTGVPVVIDGAAAAESLMDDPRATIGDIPVALSFHATKAFSTGEGGGVVTSDHELLMRAGRALNFGFRLDRLSDMPGFNGKMSEYHAAVGLAELDGWPQKRSRFAAAAATYRRASASSNIVVAPHVASGYALLAASDDAAAERAKARLTQARVGWRCWYGQGLQTHPSCDKADDTILEVTEMLGRRLIGLPMSPDLDEHDVYSVIEALKAAEL